MRIRLSIAAILVALLIPAGQVFSQTAASTRPDDGRIIDAVSKMNEGQFQKAGTELGKIVTESPSNDAAWYYLGLCHLYTRKLDEAVKCLKKASELDPSNYWYKERLAFVYSFSGEDDLTIATYEDLLKEFPKKDDLHFNLVNLYLKHNQYDKALSAMDQIEAVFGKNEQVTSTRCPHQARGPFHCRIQGYGRPWILPGSPGSPERLHAGPAWGCGSLSHKA